MLKAIETIASQQAARYLQGGSATDIDDLKQEGVLQMIEVMHRSPPPDDRKEPAPYLHGVARNAMAAWWLKYKRSSEFVSLNENIRDERIDPEESLIRAEERKLALDALKAKFGKVFA